MDDDAQEAAWQRIEAALARLETAAHGRQGDSTALATRLRDQDTRLRDQDTRLRDQETRLRDEQARHAALRHALRETLGRMDELIATHSGKIEDSAA